jgi:hypothetical protein
MRRYALALLAAVVLVITAYILNNRGTPTPPLSQHRMPLDPHEFRFH